MTTSDQVILWLLSNGIAKLDPFGVYNERALYQPAGGAHFMVQAPCPGHQVISVVPLGGHYRDGYVNFSCLDGVVEEVFFSESFAGRIFGDTQPIPVCRGELDLLWERFQQAFDQLLLEIDA